MASATAAPAQHLRPIALPHSTVLALSSSPSFPPPTMADCAWADELLKGAMDMAARGWSIKGSPIDQEFTTFARTRTLDEAKQAVYLFVTGQGNWFMRQIITRRDGDGKAYFTLDEIKALPRLDITLEQDGIYILIFGKEVEIAGQVTYEINAYAGMSWQAHQTWGVSDEGKKALRKIGYTKKEIRSTATSGVAGRVARGHLDPRTRLYVNATLYDEWDGGNLGELLTVIQAFGSNNRSTAAAEPLQDRATLAPKEFLAIMACGGWDNGPFEGSARKVGFFDALPPQSLVKVQKQVGLEMRDARDYRTPYIEGGSTHTASTWEQADERTVLRSNETANLGGAILKLPAPFRTETSRELLLEVSFNKKGAKRAWFELHPERRVGKFRPMRPEDDEHDFMVLFVHGYNYYGHVITCCLSDDNDPGANTIEMLERAFCTLVSRLWAASSAKALSTIELTAKAALESEAAEKEQVEAAEEEA